MGWIDYLSNTYKKFTKTQGWIRYCLNIQSNRENNGSIININLFNIKGKTMQVMYIMYIVSYI